MQVVDANVLIYAVNEDAAHHGDARQWLERALGVLSAETVGFSWTALLAFLRITTHPALFPRPLETSTASGIVESWLGQPGAVVVTPTARHLSILTGLLATTGSGANLVNDAHLAALALEYGASLVTFDRDFMRFAGIDVHVPLTTES